MRRGGQAMIWGIAAMLIAIGLTLFIDGFANQRYTTTGQGFSLIYVNGTLEQRVNNGVVTNVTGNLSIPSADYSMETTCEGGRCVQTYVPVSNRPVLGLVEYIIGFVFMLFGILGFYMAHKSM